MTLSAFPPGWTLTARAICLWAFAWLAVGGLEASGAAGLEGAVSPQKPGRGFWYDHHQDPAGPWSIHVFKLRRGHPGFELHTTLARGTSFGLVGVSEQMKTVPPALGTPVGAVNGDFYTDAEHYLGRPRDLQVLRGEVVSAPGGNAVFWLEPDGTPQLTNLISRFRVVWPDGTASPVGLNEERLPDAIVVYTPAVGTSTHTSGGTEYILEQSGAESWLPLGVGGTHRGRVREVRTTGDSPILPGTLVVSLGPRLAATRPPVAVGTLLEVVTETFPKLTAVQTAIGGGPTLVRNGRVQSWSGFQMRHPRSAVGFSREHIFLVEVDGRQGSLSVGMSLPELAAYMVKLGCESAMNLDGGGSATMWVIGNVINSPSEGRERPSANALVVVEVPRRNRRE